MEVPKIIELPKHFDARGNLSVIEEFKQIPFKIERAYWIYDVPGGEKRGGHAYKENEEFIVALSGSFDVVLDNGKEFYYHCGSTIGTNTIILFSKDYDIRCIFLTNLGNTDTAKIKDVITDILNKLGSN